MSCKKAQGFLEANDVEVASAADAATQRQGRDEALKIARSADTVVVARGKKVVTFHLRTDKPDDETLLAHLLGPTGNLRAPTLRRGKTLIVGFNDELYRQTFQD